MMGLHPKVQSAGLASGIVALLVWLLHDFAHVEMPPEAAAALASVISAATGYATSSDGS